MRFFYLFIFISILLSCQNNTKAASVDKNASKTASVEDANFVMQFQGKEVRLNVGCSHLDEDYFTFKSDKFDHKDTNGDGIVVSGFQNGSKLVYTLIIEDKTYSTAKLDVWSKHKNNVIGSGFVYLEGTTTKFDTSFELICK